MATDQERLSILESIERGEISIEDAGPKLAKLLQETETPNVQVEQKGAESGVATRRERIFDLTEKAQDWEPQMMMGLPEPKEWPWPDKKWQWMWQNFGYPVYVSHSVDVAEGSKLQIVLHQGDITIRSWDQPLLKVNGAAFDTRIGQDGGVVRVASSTGQMQLWVPDSMAKIEAKVMPGDVWLRNISADVDVHCQSGDLNCERIRGSVKAQVDGGDARLMGIDGSVAVGVVRGNTDVRDISSTDVSLKSSEGDIWLSLNSVSSGVFRCESSGGDINLLTNGELSCELLVEATDGGRIAPVILPWQRLLERSGGRLRGTLMDGKANISLVSQGGKIYIQESWMNTFPIPAPD